jgi:hypothetical protein
MSVRSRCALSGALILVSLAAPTAAGAVPVTVKVRVEGATRTIFDAPVVTDGHNLSPPSGGGSHICDGTNNGAFPSPGPTATAALDDAARAGGFTWDGTWDGTFSDFLVSRIATEQQNPPSQFWGHFVNGEFATAGGCQTRLAAGDETVWAFDAFNKGAILKLEGPTVATTGSPVSFRVSDTAPSGPNLPAAGASVNGTPTGSDGIATLSFPTEGIFSVKADRPDAVRSNSIRICIDPAGALPCSSTDATGPAVAFGAAGGQRGGLASTRGRSRTMLISWAGDDRAGSGVSHYKAEVSQVGDGAGASQSSWRTLIDRTTVNGVHFRGEAGAAYVFRITATDRALNETTVTTDPVIVPVDDRSQRLLRFSKRDWKRVRAGNAWGGTVVRAKEAGATARLRFRGTSLSLIGRKRAKGGRLRATIDGRRTTIRLRGRSAHRSVLWTSRKLEPGAHTLVLRALGRGTVEFDAVAPRP